MNREETIYVLQRTCEALARQRGYTDIKIGEDRQKGIWGESMTKYLEETYGSCTKEVQYRDPENSGNYVEFRFRFSDPVIALHTFERGDDKEQLANIEYSDSHADWTHYDEDRILPTWKGGDGEKTGHFIDYVHTGEFRPTEYQLWGDKGYSYQQEIFYAIQKVRDLIALDYDDLKCAIRDIVSEREGVEDGTQKAKLLDNLYLEYTNELAERDSREKVVVDIRSLYEKYRENEDPARADLSTGHIAVSQHHYKNGSTETLYDLYQNEELVCMNEEECEVFYKDDRTVVLLNKCGEEEKKFKLTKEEFEIACGRDKDREIEEVEME